MWPFHHKEEARYWLKVFAIYALIEAAIQLMFLLILNNFGTKRISIAELHLIMWVFQCVLIWPIWWVAKAVYKKPILIQVLVNAGFYILYSYCWFGPVQDLIGYLYEHLQSFTRAPDDKQVPILDSGNQYSYLNYQLLKHSFRLSVFFLAAYFYNYRLEEKKRLALAIANKDLQLRMLTWHLNPSFYFKTINHLQQIAGDKPANATGPILQLAKVMEYVIYETKEKLIAVKKEMNFLNNYLQLLNQQGANTSIASEVSGNYDQLKIAPLLLVDIIDKVAASNSTEKNIVNVQLLFAGKEMIMSIHRSPGKNDLSGLVRNDELQRRLTELYPGRFSIEIKHDGFVQLKLILDEE